MPFTAESKNGASLFSGSAHVSCQIRSAPTHPEAQQFLACWRGRSTQGNIVIGRDIPSRPFAKYLAHLMVAEPLADADYHIRLAGTLLPRYFGRDVSGERLSDVFQPPLCEQHLAAMRDVRRTGEPVILAGTIASQLLPLRSFEEVIVRAFAPDEVTIWNVVGMFVQA
jgi:hypothetical protein